MALVCFAIMFPFDWRIALITVGIVLIFYFIVFYNKPQVNWGSSPQALVFREALTSIQQLAEIEEHVKNYQPQILAMSGMPGSRPAIVDFAYLICKKNSMLVCGNVIKVRVIWMLLCFIVVLFIHNQTVRYFYYRRSKRRGNANKFLTNPTNICVPTTLKAFVP
jgi:hypothetical protein